GVEPGGRIVGVISAVAHEDPGRMDFRAVVWRMDLWAVVLLCRRDSQDAAVGADREPERAVWPLLADAARCGLLAQRRCVRPRAVRQFLAAYLGDPVPRLPRA